MINLSYRACIKADVNGWLEIRNNETAKAYNPYQSICADAAWERLSCASGVISIHEKGEIILSALMDGELVGFVGARNISSQMRTCEISYAVLPSHWGRGVGKSMTKDFVSLLFKSTFRKVYAIISADNIASINVALHSGLQLEGILRHHYVINGQAKDQLFMGAVV